MNENYIPDYTSREGREYVIDHLTEFTQQRLREIIKQWHKEWERQQKILMEFPTEK